MNPNRTTRARIAEETIEILEQGIYHHPDKGEIDIGPRLEHAVKNTRLYGPEDLHGGKNPSSIAANNQTIYQVRNETTLAAARRLVMEGNKVLALNFASAKNPGGGFLGGSQAQEESIARASGLYACIRSSPMYSVNRHCGTCLYTDHMIYSPDVPVFRDDQDRLLDEPYSVSFLTAPAVNAGVVRDREPENVPKIADVMRRRMEMIVDIAGYHGYDALVLGAWGCGVFRHRPEEVAQWFAEVLIEGKRDRGFAHINFAVLDITEGLRTLAPFQNIFERGRRAQ